MLCRSEPEGRFLYLLKDSVTAQSLLDGERGGRDKPPVPPCILPIDNNTTQISLEIDDRSPPFPPSPPSCYLLWLACKLFYCGTQLTDGCVGLMLHPLNPMA